MAQSLNALPQLIRRPWQHCARGWLDSARGYCSVSGQDLPPQACSSRLRHGTWIGTGHPGPGGWLGAVRRRSCTAAQLCWSEPWMRFSARTRSVATTIRSGRKGKARVWRHGDCPINHRSPEAAARCRNRYTEPHAPGESAERMVQGVSVAGRVVTLYLASTAESAAGQQISGARGRCRLRCARSGARWAGRRPQRPRCLAGSRPRSAYLPDWY